MAGTLTVPSSGAAGGALKLPPLREDLKLLPGPIQPDGAPTWTLHDPARHRFFRIGWLEFEILSRWSLGRSDAVARSVAEETTIQASNADVVSALQFFGGAGLLVPQGAEGTKRFMTELSHRRVTTWMWLLKNYLFLRVRLVNPDRLLRWMLGWIGWVYSKGFALTIGLLALLALHLVGQQWEAYWHSLLELFSLEGVVMVGLAMGAAKVVHEFGHGLTARRFGCRVPAMGFALMVLWPVLWTDTTDAWRLTNRRQRMAIDAAGMAAECILAVFATLLWAILPDGPPRTAAFLLSSSTWLITIVINVNPLMRFDGYYLLSDFLDVPNLQERGFAYARWWLRQTLFGRRDPPPEVLRPEIRRAVLVYALSTMVYRFFLFVGIGALVYHLTFKVLGLFLLAVEVGWFVARPIVNELRAWGRLVRVGGLQGRGLVTGLVLAALLALLLVPWHDHVDAVALLRADHEAVLYTDEPGRLVSLVASGARVVEGQAVFQLDSPTVEARLAAVRATIGAQRALIEGQVFNPEQAQDIEMNWQELQRAFAEQRSLEAERAALSVRAPFTGVVHDVPISLRPGEWLPRRERLGLLAAAERKVVEAYVYEADIGRVHEGAKAWFYPLNGEAPVALQVRSIAPASARVLETPELGSVHGGQLPTRKDAAGQVIPADSVYRAILDVDTATLAQGQRLQGNVVIEGDRESIVAEIYRRVAAVVVREMDL